jgi:methionine aminopeptidase
MSIQSYEELLALKEVRRICRLALRAMAEQVRAGVTTAELANIQDEYFYIKLTCQLFPSRDILGTSLWPRAHNFRLSLC